MSEQQAFIPRLSDAICRLGLQTPALFILDLGHPVTFLGAQLLHVAQPALSLFWPGKQIGQLAQVLEDSDALSDLLQHLEAKEA